MQPHWSELGLSLSGFTEALSDSGNQIFSVAIARPRDELMREHLTLFSSVLKHAYVYWSANSLALIFSDTAFRVATAECLNAVSICWPGAETSPLVIAVGHTVTGAGSIEYSYETARYLMRYDFTYAEDTVINLDSIGHAPRSIDWSPERLAGFIRANNRVSLRRSLRDYAAYYRANPTAESDIKVHLTQLYMRILMRIERHNQYRMSEREINESTEALRLAPTLDLLLSRLLTEFYQLTERIMDRHDLPPEEQVLIHLREHYHEAITLDVLAERMNYNAAYLGRLIKKELGLNFNRLRDEIRIEEAKRLLLETDHSVAEIAELVGIKDRDYFGQKFKSLVGRTPGEYRRLGDKNSTH